MYHLQLKPIVDRYEGISEEMKNSSEFILAMRKRFSIFLKETDTRHTHQMYVWQARECSIILNGHIFLKLDFLGNSVSV